MNYLKFKQLYINTILNESKRDNNYTNKDKKKKALNSKYSIKKVYERGARLPVGYERPYHLSMLPLELRNDPVHRWRAETGIELIHREPDIDELNRIMKNWNKMTNDMKKISDNKSIELFGMNNKDHYEVLKYIYASDNIIIREDRISKILSTLLIGINMVLPMQDASGINITDDKTKVISKQQTYSIKDLLKALIKVESGGREDAVGDNGRAKGILQLWDSYIKDVNRIYGTKYTHNDAFDPKSAIDITTKYLNHYGKIYKEKTGKPITLEILARIHNGGPDGWKKDSTNKYWNKVKIALKSVKD